MEKIITVIALFSIIGVLIAYLSSRSKAVDRVTQLAKDHEDQAQTARDEADRRRMHLEVDGKFWRELGEENLNKFTASMEPFCGEGKKP